MLGWLTQGARGWKHNTMCLKEQEMSAIQVYKAFAKSQDYTTRTRIQFNLSERKLKQKFRKHRCINPNDFLITIPDLNIMSTSPTRAALPEDLIVAASDKYPKPENVSFDYGTAGFRTKCVAFCWIST